MSKTFKWGGVESSYASPDIKALNLVSRTIICQSDTYDETDSGNLTYKDWSGELTEM